MADYLSRVLYPNPASNGPFAVPFPYLNRQHVKVYLDDVLYAGPVIWQSPTTLSLPSGTVNGVTMVDIRRVTPDATVSDIPYVHASGAISSSQVNVNNVAALYRDQEVGDRLTFAMEDQVDIPPPNPLASYITQLTRSRVPVFSIDAYGADPSGVQASDAAWAAVLVAIGISGGITTGTACIQFGAGNYRFSAPLTVVMSEITCNSITVQGLGMNVSRLLWTGSDGVKVTTKGERNSFHLQDLSILADFVGGSYTGLSITNTMEFGGGAGNAHNITRVYFAGTDKISSRDTNTKYWSSNVVTTAVSNVHYTKCSFVGAGLSGVGTGVTFQGDAARSTFAVICTITDCLFYALDVHFVYGTWVQGVHIQGTNFVNGNTAIVEVESAYGSDQLIVVNCQFNTNLNQVILRSMTHASFSDCLFFIINGGVSGISIAQGQQIIIRGCFFNALGDTVLASNGIFCGSNYPNSRALITGNTFRNLLRGVFLSADSLGWNVYGNSYAGCTTNVVNNAGAANSIGVITQ